MFQVLGIDARGKDGKPLGVQEAIMAIAKDVESRPGDYRSKAWRLKQGGASDDFVSFIMEGSEKIKRLFNAQKSMIPDIDGDIAKLNKYQESMAKFNAGWNALGITITNLLAGPLGRFFGNLSDDINATSKEEHFVTLDKGSVADRVYKWFGGTPHYADEKGGPSDPNVERKTPDTATVEEKKALIKSIFGSYGIDPEIAVRVAASEGLYNPLGDKDRSGKPTSFGEFQLHYSGDPRTPALGDIFTKETGLDARDPSTRAAQYSFIARWVAKHGWGDFHGAAKSGIEKFQGIKGGGGGITINNNVTVNDKSGDPGKTAGVTLDSIRRSNMAYQVGTGTGG